MAAEHQYFYEDEVYRINKKGNIEFGMVLENSELVSSDENSDVEEGGRMRRGHVRVAWHPTGVEEVISERRVLYLIQNKNIYLYAFKITCITE
jgi:ubiquitin-conjugating enzyme E2 O